MRFMTAHLIAALTVLALGIGTLRAAEPLKIGYSDWPGWVAWAIAEQKGFFKAHGAAATSNTTARIPHSATERPRSHGTKNRKSEVTNTAGL